MILAAIVSSVALAAAAAPAPGEGPIVRWEAPTTFVPGLPFEVKLEIAAPQGGTVLASWLMTPSAFAVDGKPLGKREDRGTVALPPGFTVQGVVDLGPQIKAGKPFKLTLSGSDQEPVEVKFLEPAPKDLDFMSLPLEQLSGYRVLLRTNRGDILVRTWPETAPNHARNFLDLASSGFYDGTTFHRVIEHFMIQGGDPTGSGTGSGPRTLDLEPSQRPHVRGVLSMARSPARDSASCQFFIMHGSARHLDGEYSAFGEVVSGIDVVDKIATTPVQRAPGAGDVSSPREPQVIERALVVKAAD